MGYYIGQFYFDKRELFLILGIIVLGIIIYFNYPIPLFRPQQLFVLLILLLITKAIIPSTKDAPLFLVFLTAIILTLFVPFFTIVVFVFIALFILKILRVI